VKVEGSGAVLKKIEALVQVGIPVMAHLGLLPQSVGVLGGYKVQGKKKEEALQLMEDAIMCEQMGAFALVLECIPYQLTKEIAKKLTIPVIGIGAGPDADGQVLVYHDLIGYGVERLPKFVKPFANVQEEIRQGISRYVKEVKEQTFPETKHSFTMKEEELKGL